MYPCPRNWLEIGRAVASYARAFSAGITYRYCTMFFLDGYFYVLVIRDPPWPCGYDVWLSSVTSKVRVSAESP